MEKIMRGLLRKKKEHWVNEGQIFIGVEDNVETLELFVDKIVEERESWMSSMYSPNKNLKIDGFDAVQTRLEKPERPPKTNFEISSWIGGLVKTTYIKKGDFIVVVEGISSPGESEVNRIEKIYDETLSTFVFTDKGFQDVPCIQVIQRARNKTTGEIKDFPTPCDVPEGWEKIEPEVMN